ncbi:MAG TPA: hypothetical protein DCO93_04480 [Clostridiales bacterium]|nr:hypothetical protein [Clostridiales bacterium]
MINIIDIGSNTIRLVTYDKGKVVSNFGVNSDIISDTKNGILSGCGIEKLCDAILYLIKKRENEEIYAFGTYAMRVLRNKEEVEKRVFEKTGINIDILSGKQEAEYDFYGLLGTILPKESGIGVDLGGGSAQILIFDKGKLTTSLSRPIGCKRVKNRFSKGKEVTKAEQVKIREYIQKNLKLRRGKKCEKIYMMGGTAKAALRLYRFLEGENADIIKTAELDRVITFIEEADEKILKKVLRARYDNIIVGIIIMREIAEIFGAKNIHIKRCGVRDGYVLKIEQKKKAI